MNITVVVAGSDPSNMVQQCSRAVSRSLDSHRVDLIDLDEDCFRPAMTADERVAYFTDTPVRDPLVAHYGEMVNRADALVFVYHSTRGGLPALTKGWLEKVMVPGVAFGFDENGTIEPRLRHVRRIAGVVTYDESRIDAIRYTDGGRRTLLRALRASTGLRTRTSWVAKYDIGMASDEERAAFLNRVERRFRRW